MINPAPGIIIVEKLQTEDDKTASGLVMVARSTPIKRSKVVKVGPGFNSAGGAYVEPPVRENEILLSKEDSMLEVFIEGKSYFFIRFADVLGYSAAEKKSE